MIAYHGQQYNKLSLLLKTGIKPAMKYNRVLLKLSGEILRNKNDGESIDSSVLAAMADQIEEVARAGVEIAVVIGGGNIFRGLTSEGYAIERSAGDHMGMLATIINSLALQATLEERGLQTRVMTAISMRAVAEPFIRRKAVRHLQKNRIVIFGGGTGNPYFSTDSAAALRAAEIDADLLMKATKVDGIYSSDPLKKPQANKYSHITYREALDKQLKIMDSTAFSLCRENQIPICVFNFFKKKSISKVVNGEKIGTLVH